MVQNLSNNKRTNILIDWLQVFCVGHLKKSNILIYKELQYGTKVFSTVIEIWYRNEFIATLAYLPRSRALNPLGCLIKLKNNCLYSDKPAELLEMVLFETGFEFKSISRLDLCTDFNSFNNCYQPENLIKDYLQLKITKKGKNKATCHFWQGQQIEFQTLRFGTNSSDISFYLYNKTQELKDVVFKKYIVDNWQIQNLDVLKNVWRLECSIKGNIYKKVNKQTGEISTLNLNDLKNVSNLEGIFFYYLHRNFEFVINSNIKNKAQKKKIKLFSENYELMEFTKPFKTDDCTRMDKIFINMLESYNCEIRNSKRYYKDDLEYIIKDYCEKKGITDFYYKKIAHEPEPEKEFICSNIPKIINDLPF